MGIERLYGAIGLAEKAGRCRSGDFAVEKLVKSGGAKLVLLDAEASASTAERYARMCESAGIPLLSVADMGHAIGKPAHRIAAVTDENFKILIMGAYTASTESTGGMN